MTRRPHVHSEPLTIAGPVAPEPQSVLLRALRLCVSLEPAHLGPTDGRPCPRCISESRRALAARSVLSNEQRRAEPASSPGTTGSQEVR